METLGTIISIIANIPTACASILIVAWYIAKRTKTKKDDKFLERITKK